MSTKHDVMLLLLTVHPQPKCLLQLEARILVVNLTAQTEQ